LLAEWRTLQLLRDRSLLKEEQNWLKMKILAQALYEFALEYSPIVKDKIYEVFKLDDPESHGVAIDAFWEFLKKENSERHLCSSPLNCPMCISVDNEFNTFVNEYVNNPAFASESVMRSLMGTLIDEVWFPIKPVAFNNRVVRPGLWKSFFLVLQNCTLQLKAEFLKDTYSLFIDNEENAFNLINQKSWIRYLMPIIPTVQGFDGKKKMILTLFSDNVFLHRNSCNYKLSHFKNFIPFILQQK
jgi:hypothetical protein